MQSSTIFTGIGVALWVAAAVSIFLPKITSGSFHGGWLALGLVLVALGAAFLFVWRRLG